MFQLVPIALAVIVVLFLIIVAMQPGAFRVSRSAEMAAPASKIISGLSRAKVRFGFAAK
jgi:hypothetical protein